MIDVTLIAVELVLQSAQGASAEVEFRSSNRKRRWT
jgi:hypothetical protein